MSNKNQNEKPQKHACNINLSENDRIFVALSFQEEGFFSTNYSVRDALPRIVIGFRVTDYDWSINLSKTLGVKMGLEPPSREGFSIRLSYRRYRRKSIRNHKANSTIPHRGQSAGGLCSDQIFLS